MNARQETQTVKRALIEAGFDKKYVRVGHDTGTAAGWLDIQVNQIKDAEHSYQLAYSTAQRVTGRHGDYHGLISVSVSRGVS